MCIPFISLLTDTFSALSLGDLRHTITFELQDDHTFFISVRTFMKEFAIFALPNYDKRLVKFEDKVSMISLLTFSLI